MDRQLADDARAEAFAIWEMFGASGLEPVQRRIAYAIDRQKLEDAMFWLEVQTQLYGFSADVAGRSTRAVGAAGE